jgi:hypothetical protein
MERNPSPPSLSRCKAVVLTALTQLGGHAERTEIVALAHRIGDLSDAERALAAPPSHPNYGTYVNYQKAGVMSFVRPGGTMTCASARYVARRLIRQFNRNGEFGRKWFDGYVTWHGRVIGRRSSGVQIIRFREYRSGTSITFDWQVTVF